MPTVAHSSLTGVNSHEPKGVESATAGKAYISDGANSGDWTYPGGHVYGSIYSKDGAIAIGTIGTTPKKFEVFTADGPSNQTTPAHASDQITVGVAGDYYVSGAFTIATAAAGDAGLYQIHLRVNGTENAAIGGRYQLSGSADTAEMHIAGIVTLAANDVVTVYVESDDAGADDLVVNAANLSVFLLKAA
jgi:hypothetical protein